MLTTARFWRETAERAVKTAAQSAVLFIAADQVNALSLDYVQIGGFALGGALLSVLTSVGSVSVGEDKGSPSVV